MFKFKKIEASLIIVLFFKSWTCVAGLPDKLIEIKKQCEKNQTENTSTESSDQWVAFEAEDRIYELNCEFLKTNPHLSAQGSLDTQKDPWVHLESSELIELLNDESLKNLIRVSYEKTIDLQGSVEKSVDVVGLAQQQLLTLGQSGASECQSGLSEQSARENDGWEWLVNQRKDPQFISSVLGSPVVLTYEKNGETFEHSGILLNFDGDSFELFDENVGTSERFTNYLSPKIKIQNFRFAKKVGSRMIQSNDKAKEYLSQGKSVFGTAVVNSEGKFRYLSGEIRAAKTGVDYTIYTIKDSLGKTHKIDTRVSKYFFIKSVSPERESRAVLIPLKDHDSLPYRDVIDDQEKKIVKNLLQGVLTNRNPFEWDEFYQTLDKNPDYADRLIGRWYDLSERHVEHLRSKFGRAFPLLADPGIITRKKAFLSFLKSRKEGGSLWDIRKEFSKSLGEVPVYRSMILTPEQHEKHLKEGMRAYAQTYSDDTLTSYYESLFMTRERNSSKFQFENNPVTEVENRVNGLSRVDMRNYMSLSEYPEVSKSAGYFASTKVDGKTGEIVDPKLKFYFYELQLPAISLVYLSPKDGNRFNFHSPGDVTIKVGDSFAKDTSDPKVEMFVPYEIRPKFIRVGQKETTKPDHFEYIHHRTGRDEGYSDGEYSDYED